MIFRKGRKGVFTGAKPQNKPTPNVPTDAAHPSRDMEKKIMGSPQPFQNPRGAASTPAGSMAPPTPNAIGSAPGQAAVGQNRPINQSGQVYGPKGISHPSHTGGFTPPSVRGGAKDAGGKPKMKGAGTMRTTDPMAGQHGKKAFYGE